jgi:hypothetical protein
MGWHSSGIRIAGFPENPDFHDVQVFNNILTDDAHVPMSTNFENLQERSILFTNNLLYPAINRMPEWMQSNRNTASYGLTVGEKAVTADPLYVNSGRRDYRLSEGSPAIDSGSQLAGPDPDDSAPDLGALPYGSAWRPGFDWAGNATAYYQGKRTYRPVDIPTNKFTLHRNHLERPSWFQTGRYGADLQHLQGGEHSMAGVTFFIEPDDSTSAPTVLGLNGFGSEVTTRVIRGIPIGEQADSLAFLHAWHERLALRSQPKGDPEQAPVLFEYIVHYADGSEEKIPVVWGLDIDHWQGSSLEDLPDAKLAWHQPVFGKVGGSDRTENIRLYLFEWENPQPASEIESVDMVSVAPFEYGAPATFAISTGHDL